MINSFLTRVMSEDINTTLTICGPVSNRQLMNEYEAYYTLHNNVIYTPVNYSTIKDKVETFEGAKKINKEKLINIHNKKIERSDGIIVVIGEDGRVGSDTMAEVALAYMLDKKILLTKIKQNEFADSYEFNHNMSYPLYLLKES